MTRNGPPLDWGTVSQRDLSWRSGLEPYPTFSARRNIYTAFGGETL